MRKTLWGIASDENGIDINQDSHFRFPADSHYAPDRLFWGRFPRTIAGDSGRLRADRLLSLYGTRLKNWSDAEEYVPGFRVNWEVFVRVKENRGISGLAAWTVPRAIASRG